MFFTAFVQCILRLFKLKTEDQILNRKPHCKVTKLKSKFSLNLGQLNRALKDRAQELRFKAWLNPFIRPGKIAQSITKRRKQLTKVKISARRKGQTKEAKDMVSCRKIVLLDSRGNTFQLVYHSLQFFDLFIFMDNSFAF